jgi:hypothetical protein
MLIVKTLKIEYTYEDKTYKFIRIYKSSHQYHDMFYQFTKSPNDTWWTLIYDGFRESEIIKGGYDAYCDAFGIIRGQIGIDLAKYES